MLLSLLLSLPVFAQQPDPAEAAEVGAEDELPPIVKNPELIDFVQAPYPEEAKAAGIEGVVVLLLEIDELGAVTYVEILQEAGNGFDEAAMAAAWNFRFSPAEDTEGPTAVAIEFEYGFVLDAASVEGALPEELPEEQVPAELPVTLRGTAIEMATRQKLPEMSVALAGTDFVTSTDAEGAFAFRGVPPGSYELVMARPGWATRRLQVEVGEGEVTVAEVWVRNESYEDALVMTYRPETDEITRHTISMSEVRKIPGTFGDPVRVIQNLPGAARAPFSSGVLIIRGANPEDSGVYIDGIRIPLIYHIGGYVSVINPELVQSVDYLPGSYGVQYGRTLGGAIDVTSKKEAPEQGRVSWSTDLLDSGGLYEGRLGSEGQHHVGVAARRSYIDVVLKPFQKNRPFTVAPRWSDYQLRYSYLPEGSSTTVTAFVFGFDDKLVLSSNEDVAQGPDQDAQGEISVHTFTHRAIVSVDHAFSDTLHGHVTPSIGIDHSEFGAGQAFRLDQNLYTIELRSELVWSPNEHFTLVPGIDFGGGGYDFQVELPVDPNSFDDYDPLGEREDWGVSDSGTAWGPDVYLKTNLQPLADTDRLFVQAGLRWSAFYVPGQYSTQGWDPRISGRLRVLPKGYLKAATGIYTQPPQATESWQPEGDYTLGMERAWSSSVGWNQQFSPGVSGQVEGFYKDLSDLIVFNRDWGSIEDNAYQNAGTGTIYGFELMLRQDPVNRAFGWISYTYSVSERQDYPDEEPYLFDFDQTHILTVLGGYTLPWQVDVSGRFQYVTGNPYTPYSGAIYDVDQDYWNCYSTAPRNSDRLGAYQALDLRVERGFTFQHWRMDLYADFLNVYKGDNPEFRVNNYDCTEYRDVSGLPFLPSPGIELEFYL